MRCDWYFGLVEFVGVFAIALVVGVGGWLVHAAITVGTVAAFVLLLASLFEPVQQLSQLYNTVQSAAAALHKLSRSSTRCPTSPSIPTRSRCRAGRPRRPRCGVRVRRHVGRGARRCVARGRRRRAAGARRPTGAGKSTLAKLLSRLYDPTTGRSRFGEVDLRLASLASLRERIVVVPQEGFLFGGTIRDNIRIARPGATDDEVPAALDSIGVLERFEEFPEGLGTEVRERGSRLSAGERQLVSLARAALVDPAVLVLDEATSNLDPGTEAVVERALEALMPGRTVIVVAHRLSTVRRADRIAVIDHAVLAELGTHDELIAGRTIRRARRGVGTLAGRAGLSDAVLDVAVCSRRTTVHLKQTEREAWGIMVG